MTLVHTHTHSLCTSTKSRHPVICHEHRRLREYRRSLLGVFCPGGEVCLLLICLSADFLATSRPTTAHSRGPFFGQVPHYWKQTNTDRGNKTKRETCSRGQLLRQQNDETDRKGKLHVCERWKSMSGFGLVYLSDQVVLIKQS